MALNAEFVPPHETGAAMYVRPQIYGSSAQLGLNPPDEYMFLVYVVPTGVYHGVHPVKCLILDEFDRAAPNGTGNAKVGGNYAPVLRWTDKARDEGYNITLHLDSAKHDEVDEFSTSGFVGALVDGDKVTIVVPDSKAVIDSVTSDSVQQIARSLGWNVEKRAVSTLPTHLTSQDNILISPFAGALHRSSTPNSPLSPKSWPPEPPPASFPSALSPATFPLLNPSPSPPPPRATSVFPLATTPRPSLISPTARKMPDLFA